MLAGVLHCVGYVYAEPEAIARLVECAEEQRL